MPARTYSLEAWLCQEMFQAMCGQKKHAGEKRTGRRIGLTNGARTRCIACMPAQGVTVRGVPAPHTALPGAMITAAPDCWATPYLAEKLGRSCNDIHVEFTSPLVSLTVSVA